MFWALWSLLANKSLYAKWWLVPITSVPFCYVQFASSLSSAWLILIDLFLLRVTNMLLLQCSFICSVIGGICRIKYVHVVFLQDLLEWNLRLQVANLMWGCKSAFYVQGCKPKVRLQVCFLCTVSTSITAGSAVSEKQDGE